MGTPAEPAAAPGQDAIPGFPLPSELVPASGNGQAPPPAPAAPAAEPEPPAADQATELRTALAEERRRHRETVSALTKLQQQGMTDQDRAIAEAKAQGKAEAIRDAGARVAAAEFQRLAAGKLADPVAALELLDLTKFVSEDGEVDTKALGDMVEKLAAQLARPGPPAKIPAGPMGEDVDSGDFLRQALKRNRS